MEGEIVFCIADEQHLDIDFGKMLLPTRIVQKGEVIALQKKAPKNQWIYRRRFKNEKEYLGNLEKVVSLLYKHREYILRLKNIYEEISITIYIRSDYAQIGFSLPSKILGQIAQLNLSLHFDLLSFGMVRD